MGGQEVLCSRVLIGLNLSKQDMTEGWESSEYWEKRKRSRAAEKISREERDAMLAETQQLLVHLRRIGRELEVPNLPDGDLERIKHQSEMIKKRLHSLAERLGLSYSQIK
jgi:hypothetical protein